MSALMLVAQAAARADEGLTFAEILRDIPHDPASIVVYALVIGSVTLVIRAGRKRPSPTNPQGPAAPPSGISRPTHPAV